MTLNFAVLYSKKDEAGVSIANALKQDFAPQIPIIELKKESIFSENIDKELDIKKFDFLVFASKHQSKAGEASLSVHAPGNWNKAEFGGKPAKVCPTNSQVLKFLFQKLNENAKNISASHNITLECTHHGPYIETPCCFIEIGSNQQHWKDKELAKIIAKTILDLQNFKPTKTIKSAIAIGGPHYCPNFNKIQLSSNSNIAIGHIIPEYALPLTEPMLKEALSKNQKSTDLVLLDWKGCGNSENRQNIIQLLEKAGLEHERTERIEK